jgi:monothiol glutaredoxin
MEASTKAEIDSLIGDNNVVLFMKGNRRMPQCGFSATVVGILDGLIDDYATVDILANPAIRSGIKEYSDWPTLPQLYIGGEFQGGCDIVREMASNGELHTALGVDVEIVAPPEMTLTDGAAAALIEAGAKDSGEGIRFTISPDFRYGLSLGPKMFGDTEMELSGFTFYLDSATAKRGAGTVIDYVTSTMGAGFQISNPAEPAKLQQVPPAAVQAWLAAGEELELIDVRPADERATASIEGTTLLDESETKRIEGLDKGTRLVFHCHHGRRSQQVAERFLGLGFTNVVNLAGGIDAWSAQVDSTVPRY